LDATFQQLSVNDLFEIVVTVTIVCIIGKYFINIKEPAHHIVLVLTFRLDHKLFIDLYIFVPIRLVVVIILMVMVEIISVVVG